ncbi:Glyoxalase/Bleomycin resistance protein/Dioxygenase superfamily protein [Streptomyces sp. TLI_053]|uniref:VOC family protein n=1 Tax=Streptomyces sp. TLI_053 TaxID=1855352 RepID=UPI00087CF7AB|nr:VOC family protein [Streptomyces sp. TLI_053]SDT83079.1 Glyoxalase/Bleomycin resistance protein/Dioxygenase superfamily protein [Streptomyces sp. TLI_053]
MNVVASTVVLSITDPGSSSRFFTTHLGYREVLADEESVVLVRDDAAPDVLLRQRDLELPPGPRAVGALVSFAVTGIAAEYERLRRAGANLTVPLRREPWGELLLELTDPNGVVVRLTEWIPPAGR